MIQIVEDAIPVNMQEQMIISAQKQEMIFQNNTSYGVFDTDSILGKRIKMAMQKDVNIVDNGQYMHMCLNQVKVYSDFYNECLPILLEYAKTAGIEVRQVKRCKLNMLVQDKSFQPTNYNAPHVDMGGTYSFLYYINDSDGDTVFFNQHQRVNYHYDTEDEKLTVLQKVTPKMGRGIFFESNRYHSSSNPKNTENRLVLNFNFI